jgi:RimJ/RimL family protein N-acetyltransferase
MTSNEEYRIMPRSELSDGVITLRLLRQGDIENIRLWRNAQMDVLRQAHPISSEEQVRYFEQNVWPEKKSSQPRQILLGLELADKLIGYGGLVNLHWADHRGEISFLLSDEIEVQPALRAEIFARFLLLIKELSLKTLGLQRIWTETYSFRKAHIETLEASGFVREGCMRKHMIVNGERTDSLIHGVICGDLELGS